MKLIVELSENDYKALKEDGVQNHLALADTIIACSVPYEERPQGEWKYTTHYARLYRVCPFCTAEKEDDRSAGWNFCWYCGADMRNENKFQDLVVFDDQPKRQLEDPDCHNEL